MVQWCQADLSSNDLKFINSLFPHILKIIIPGNEVQLQLILFCGLD